MDDILASERQRETRLLDLAAEVLGLKRRNAVNVSRATQQAYKRARRFLRRAEREYDRALSDWVGS